MPAEGASQALRAREHLLGTLRLRPCPAEGQTQVCREWPTERLSSGLRNSITGTGGRDSGSQMLLQTIPSKSNTPITDISRLIVTVSDGALQVRVSGYRHCRERPRAPACLSREPASASSRRPPGLPTSAERGKPPRDALGRALCLATRLRASECQQDASRAPSCARWLQRSHISPLPTRQRVSPPHSSPESCSGTTLSQARAGRGVTSACTPATPRIFPLT